MSRPDTRQRINRIALARFEEWALPRMARRLPAWVTPDLLTGIGLFAAVLIAISYFLTSLSLVWLWLASAGFVLHWWADSLDGTLARVRNIERPRYGFFVDHHADAIAAILIFTGIGLSPLMPLATAYLALIGYLALMIHVHMVAITRNVFKISFGRVGPTEARLAMILANVSVVALGNPAFTVLGFETSIFGAVGAVGGASLLIIYVVSVLVERARLARVDPTPGDRDE